MNEEGLIDVVVLMRPPVEWWPRGVVGYPGDHNGVCASLSGEIPNPSLVSSEFDSLVLLLINHQIPHVILNFPAELNCINQPPQGAYDAVFIRDCAIVAPSGTAYVPARFRDCRRQIETSFVMEALDLLGLQRLCEVDEISGFVEGGDTINGILPSGEKYLFTGTQRNNNGGSSFLREILEIPKNNHLEIETPLCHIDSVMCAISHNEISGQVLQFIILCSDLITSSPLELARLIEDSGLPKPIAAKQADTSHKHGSLAINGISVKAKSNEFFITAAQFTEQQEINKILQSMGITHIQSPLTQYLKFSSGGVRCSTQVIKTTFALLRELQAQLPCSGIDKIWIP